MSAAAPSPLEAAVAAAARLSFDATFSPLDVAARRGGGDFLAAHLLHASLAQAPGGLERYELSLRADGLALAARARLGRASCGHPAFVHGGALAALLDDAMGTLVAASPHGAGVTASLTVDYRAPTPAGAELRVLVGVDAVETGKSGAKKLFLVARIEAAGDAGAAGGGGAAGGAEGGAEGGAGGSGGAAAAPAPPLVYAVARALFIVRPKAAPVFAAQ